MNSNISQALKNIRLKILWVSRLMSSVFVPSQNGPNKMINASHDLPMCLSVLAYSIRNIIPGSAILNYTR